MARRRNDMQRQMVPQDVERPPLARDPGLTMRPFRVETGPVSAALSDLGRAQQNFGRALGDIANTFDILAKKRQEPQDDMFRARYELNRAQLGEPVIQEHLTTPKEGHDYITEGDGKLVGVGNDAYNKTKEELGYEPSSEGRSKIELSNLNWRETEARRMGVAGNNARVGGMVEGANTTADGIAKLVEGDPDQLTTALGSVDTIADGLKGVLPEVNDGRGVSRASLKKAYRQMVYEAAIRGYDARGESEKAQAIIDQLTGVAGETANVVHHAIIDGAKAEGAPILETLAIVRHETAGTFDPKSKTFIDPKTGRRASTASGLFHMIASTAEAYAGVKDFSALSPEEQARAGAKLVRDNIELLTKTLGGAPTAGEIYLAHVLGGVKAVKLLKADPDTLLTTLLSAKELTNSGIKGKTVGDMRAWAQTIMQSNMDAIVKAGILEGRPIDPNEAGIPIDEAHKLNAVIERGRGRRVTENTRRARVEMASMTPDQMEIYVSDYEPAPDDYGHNRQLYDNVGKEAEKIIELRREDPAKAVQEIPAVAEAYQKAESDQPEDIQNAVKISLQAQSEIGIPAYAQKPITTDEAKNLAMPIIAVSRMTGRDDITTARSKRGMLPGQMSESEAVEQVVTTVIEKYGDYADDVLPHVIEQTTKDRQFGPLAASMFRKLIKGDKITPGQKAALDSASDASNATKALKVPTPKYPDQPEMSASAQAQYPAASPRAVQALRDDPKRASEFDRKYGPGAANRYLKAKPDAG